MLTVVFHPLLSQPQVLPGGDFQMLLFGNTNRSYAVEVSINASNGQMPVAGGGATQSGPRGLQGLFLQRRAIAAT